MKRNKVLLIFDSPKKYDDAHTYEDEFKQEDWKTEAHVFKALGENGHDVKALGLTDTVIPLVKAIENYKPDIVFNLAEVFNNDSRFEKHIAGLLEMMNIPYTGATSESLLLCNNKGLTKKILMYHRIKVPHFHIYYRHRRVQVSKRLRLPLIVKPLCEEASRGISLASVVDTEEALQKRVSYIHDTLNLDAIAEEYIPGREFYVGVIGNKRIRAFPLIEMKFLKIPHDETRIASYKAKWDSGYRKKWGICNVFPGKLPQGLEQSIHHECKRAYKELNMKCYARFDVRVTPGGRVFIIEANANPCLAKDEDFAMAAQKMGLTYEQLINKIIEMSLKRSI